MKHHPSRQHWLSPPEVNPSDPFSKSFVKSQPQGNSQVKKIISQSNVRESATSSLDQPITTRKDLSATSSSSIEPRRCTPHELWHLRFGHASNLTLRNLSLIKSSYDTTNCRACIQAKQHRNLFQAVESSTKKLATKFILTFVVHSQPPEANPNIR